MKRILSICFIACLSHQAWASAPIKHHKHHHFGYVGHPYIGIGGGIVYPKINTHDNYVATGPGWPNDQYVYNNSVNHEPTVYVSGGYAWTRKSTWLPSFAAGLRYNFVSGIKAQGYINQYSLPQYQNYNFRYNIQQKNLLATFKVDVFNWKNLMPYLLVGAGISVNNVSNYQEAGLSNVTPRVSPGYGTNSNTNFAYLFGVGLDYAIKKNLWINVEYNHANFGPVKTANGANYATATGSNFSTSYLNTHIKANTALLGISYFVG